MRFTKMHGAGNDYVYIDCFAEPVPRDFGQLARRVSDRHFGIGSDGLVLILPSDDADAEMRMFNADGSEAQMCGNALRCVAWFLRDRGLCSHDTPAIATGRGTLRAEVLERTATGGSVRIDMGEPILEPAAIPTKLNPATNAIIDIDGTAHQVTCISMGNPHCVLFVDSVEAAPLQTLGPKVETHPVFPERTNVPFAQAVDRKHLRLRVWERGTGETLACGTGACAAVVAAILNDLTDRHVTVSLPGGKLQIEWQEDGPVRMTGPVVEVFRGELT